jgi:hypothetical protein
VSYGKRSLKLVAPRSLLRVVRVDRPLVEEVVAPAAVSLPVERGQPLGEVRVYARGRLIASSPLVAGRSIGRPGLLGRIGWYGERMVDRVWSWVTP